MNESSDRHADVPGSSKGALGAPAHTGARGPKHPGSDRSSLPGFLHREPSPSVASNARSQPARAALGGTRSSGSSSQGLHPRQPHPCERRAAVPPHGGSRRGHGSCGNMLPRPTAAGSNRAAAGSSRPRTSAPPAAAGAAGDLQLPFSEEPLAGLKACMQELAAGQPPEPRLDNHRTPKHLMQGPLPVAGAEAWAYWPCYPLVYLGGRVPGGTPEMAIPAVVSRALIKNPKHHAGKGKVTLVVAVPRGTPVPHTADPGAAAAAAARENADGQAAAAAAEGLAPPGRLPAALETALEGQWVEVQRLQEVEYERLKADSAAGQKPTRLGGGMEGLRCWSTWSQLAIELVQWQEQLPMLVLYLLPSSCFPEVEEEEAQPAAAAAVAEGLAADGVERRTPRHAAAAAVAAMAAAAAAAAAEEEPPIAAAAA